MATTETNGYESAATAIAPRKVRGTTPGNPVWSYYVESGINFTAPFSFNIAVGLSLGQGAHFFDVGSVVEDVMHRLEVKTLLYFRIGAN